MLRRQAGEAGRPEPGCNRAAQDRPAAQACSSPAALSRLDAATAHSAAWTAAEVRRVLPAAGVVPADKVCRPAAGAEASAEEVEPDALEVEAQDAPVAEAGGRHEKTPIIKRKCGGERHDKEL